VKLTPVTACNWPLLTSLGEEHGLLELHVLDTRRGRGGSLDGNSKNWHESLSLRLL